MTIHNNIRSNARTFRVVVTKHSDDEYLAEIPSLKHCITSGKTIEEAIENIHEVLGATLEIMQEEGISIPDDSQNIEFTIQKTLSSDLHHA